MNYWSSSESASHRELSASTAAEEHPVEGVPNQRWSTFVRNHAKAIVACDFFVSVTVTFKVLYVFVAMEVGSRRILHCNVTEHPTAEWTTQQIREVLADVHPQPVRDP